MMINSKIKTIIEDEECLSAKGRRICLRGVIKNDDKVLLLYSKEFNDYTFPGGGKFKDESFFAALKRELREEIGAVKIDIIREFADVNEYKYSFYKHSKYIQFSRYYLVNVLKFGNTEFTKKEIESGLQTCWIDPKVALIHNQLVLKDDKHQKKGLKTSLLRANYILGLIIKEKEEMEMRKFEIVTKYKDMDIKIPQRQTIKSAGYDIESANNYTIEPGQTVMIETGIKALMPADEALFIYPRSSLSVKKNIFLANSVGVIDSDYYNNEKNEGHILVPLHNFGNTKQEIIKGERIVQGIFMKYEKASGQVLNNTRTGGFGSTK